MIEILSLASGSSGNALFVRVDQTRLLIDAGISCRRIEQGLSTIDETPERLDAVLLTHEHSDHVGGLARLFDLWPQIPLFCTGGTTEASADKFEPPANYRAITVGDSFRIADLEVTPFDLAHDAREPCGFRLDAHGFAMGIATDLGRWSEETVAHLSGCRAIVLEANHDAEMLRQGPYPGFLKRRIAGPNGHLSNDQARALLSRVAGNHLEWVVLAHLSQKNNAPERAVEHVSRALDDSADTEVVAAGPRPSALIEMEIDSAAQTITSAPRQGVLF